MKSNKGKFMKILKLVTLLLVVYVTRLCPQQNKEQLTNTQGLAIGCISGAVGMTVYLPFAYAQNRIVQKLAISKNPLHWYRGLPVVAGTVAAITGPQVLINNMALSYLKGENKTNSNKNALLAASIAGVVTAPFINASELLTQHQQNSKQSLVQTVKSLPHGVRSLTKGMGVVGLREVVWSNAYQALVPIFKKMYAGIMNEKLAVTTAAITTGVAAGLITNVFQVTKVKLHADLLGKQYKNGLDALKYITEKEGIKGFTSGVSARALGLTLAIPAMMLTSQALKKMAQNYQNN